MEGLRAVAAGAVLVQHTWHGGTARVGGPVAATAFLNLAPTDGREQSRQEAA